MADLRDYTKKNPIFVGTDGVRLPTGTNAQRVASANVAGTMRFNTDIDGIETYTTAGWRPLAAPPSISTVSPSTFSGESGTEFTINGEGFTPDAQVYFVTSNGTSILASTVSYYSAVQVRATTPRAIRVQEEPISVRVVQQSGTTTKTDCIDAGGVPNWITTAGTLGSIFGANTVNVYVSATDPEGTAISYQITSGSLPGGLNFTTANGLIQGLASSVLANTTYNFTIKANDTVSNNTDRSFSYTVLNRAPVINTAAGSLGTIYSGNAASASISAYDPDGGQLTYSVSSGTLPVNSSLGSANGVITGTPVVVTTNTTYSFTLTSTDEGSLTASNNYTYTVLNRPPLINTAAGSLGTIVSGNAISTTIDAYDPDGAAVSFAITSGNLMATANIGSSNGTITASNDLIVLANTTYTFTVRATDVGEMSVSNTYTYTVLNRPPLWNTAATLTSYSPDTFTPITVNAYDPDGGSVTYSLTSGSVPSGLSFVSANATITGTPADVTDNTTSTFTVTVTDPGSDANARTFSLTITAPLDAQFANTSLLLRGAANTVIKDVSTNNLPITVVGDAGAFNFSPYNSSWSVNFESTSNTDAISFPSNAAYNIGTGNFTVEFWLNPSLFSGFNQRFFLMGVSGTTNLAIEGQSAGSLTVVFEGTTVITYSWSPTLSNWYHIAVCRVGSAVTLYINGVSVATATSSTSISNNIVNIGSLTWAGDYNTKGYLSNVRFSANTAFYTSNFTPSTTPLTSISGTALLTCQSNRFVDNVLNVTPTRTGTPSVSGFSPFEETDTTTGSMYFDGSGDYLTIPNDTAFSYNSIFSAELWYYSTHTSCTDVIPFSGNGNWDFIIPAATTVAFRWFVPGYGDTGAHTMLPNSWNHIAVSVSGGRLSFYLNGTRMYTNASVSFSLGGSDTSKIGYGSNSLMKGYISNVRVTRGSTPYDPTQTTITVPTSPLTTISGTTFLTLQNRQPHNNYGFIDSSRAKRLTTKIGNTSQGTFTPFSPTGWSNFFDGSDDDFYVPYSSSLNLSTPATDWTVECFFQLSNNTAAMGLMGASDGGGNTAKYFMGVNFNTSFAYTANRVNFFTNTGASRWIDAPYTWVVGQWYHIAAVYTQSNTTITLYVNGVSVGSTPYNAAGTTGSVFVGQVAEGYYFNGYISNFRIVKGTAVYTSNFTPSTTPLTAIANTVLLTCQSNRFIDNSTINSTLTRNSSPTVQAFSPFAPTSSYTVANTGGSVYLDGTEDQIRVGYPTDYTLSSSNWSFECWYYTTNAAFQGLLSKRTGGVASGWEFSTSGMYGDLAGTWRDSNSIVGEGAGTYTSQKYGQWTHICYTRSGTNVRMFINGKLTYVKTDISGSIQQLTDKYLTIGANGANGSNENLFIGYISGMRFIIGSIPTGYQTASTTAGTQIFTPPTSPVTLTSQGALANSVSMLMDFSDAAIKDATSKHVIETVADTKVNTAQSKFSGSGAMYFDGTGDYLTLKENPIYRFGASDFTIEGWIYPTSIGGSGYYTLSWHNNGSSSSNVIGTTQINPNVWTHIAWSKSGTSMRFFINGVLDAGGVQSVPAIIYNNADPLRIAYGVDHSAGSGRDFCHCGEAGGGNNKWFAYFSNGGTGNYIGYIVDFRITRVARYTTTFTPPTKSFAGR